MARIASIDIGTNTILLLIAEVQEVQVTPLFESEAIVRLGEGLQRSRMLLPGAMERAIQALFDCLEQCQYWGVQRVFAVGTSALREALNSQEFLERVKQRLQVSIEVISGEEEAELSFLAVSRDLLEPERTILVVDVGGGSTELIWGRAERIEERWTLPLGSVRFTEQFLLSDPVQDREYGQMEEAVKRLLSNVPRTLRADRLVAVGGTATTLAQVEQGLNEFSVQRIHRFVLSAECLERQVKAYRSRSLEQRKSIPGLPPARAEVILAGATILLMAMKHLWIDSAMISSQGVRYGLIYKKLNL